MRGTPVSTKVTTDDTRAHIDAETLAAWADHGLNAAAAAEVELHLSTCERCQEVLAAFARSAPAAAVVIPFWARRPVRWSAAGLAAAAALFLIVKTGQTPAVQAPDMTVASRDIAPPSPAPPSSPPSKSAPSPPVSLAAPPVTVRGAAPAVMPPAAPRPALPQIAAMAESVAFDTSTVIEIVAPEPASATRQRTAAGSGGAAGAAARMASASPPATNTRWRIVGGTQVEQSVDAGVTWSALPIEPPLATPLLAGGASSPTVCWLVGLEGVVLVTTDGRTFRRVSLPEAVALSGVTVTDGLRATVTAADGRRFSTTDGGLTWR